MEFTHDAFLSHSTVDKDVVRQIANKLKDQKIKVWFDEWEINKTDIDRQEKLDVGLSGSGKFLLFWSKNYSSSQWAKLEKDHFLHTAPPENWRTRLFVLILDETKFEGLLSRFAIKWDNGNGFDKLLKFCQQPVEDKVPLTKLLEGSIVKSSGADGRDITDQIKDLKDELSKELTREITATLNANLTKDLTSALTKDLTTTLTVDLTASLTRDLTVSLTRDLTVSLTRDLTVSLTRDLTATLTRDLTATLTRDLTATLTRDLTATPQVSLRL
jgi:TIR domain